MKLNLDPEVSKRLREKVNEWWNFTYEKEAKFKIPGKNKEGKAKAYSCICACMDRIDALVDHCNKIEINDIWGLCDILNYGQTLIDCITRIGEVYGVTYNIQGDVSSFKDSVVEEKGNDEKYFKYLRSLCSVHPVDTSQHPIYQGEENEWCPYISESKGTLAKLGVFGKGWENVDFYATVYRNDMTDVNKRIPIRVPEILDYLNKRYTYIEEIIKAIEAYNQEKIAGFRNKKIPQPEDFDNYIDYLLSLERAEKERYGAASNCVREWQAIMKSHYKDEKMQKYLQEYQSELKQKIKVFHNCLQEMEEDDCSKPYEGGNTEFIENGYALSKLYYLEPEFENMDDINEVIADNGKICQKDADRVKPMIEVIEEEQRNNASDKELEETASYINGRCGTSNSEWARIQLKIIEPCFENILEFNYFLSDWYLYLQVQIAIWLVNNKH